MRGGDMAGMNRRDKLDLLNTTLSAASLGVGILALCLNEKKEEDIMPSRAELEKAKEERKAAALQRKTATQKRKKAKEEAKARAQEQKAKKAEGQTKIRNYANSIGYSGPIIMPNAKAGEAFAVIPLSELGSYGYGAGPKKTAKKSPAKKEIKNAPAKKSTALKKTAPKKAAKSNGKTAWVAMEVNKKTGGDRQAVVCSSEAEAKRRALEMKNAHHKGSQQSKDCIQGYARLDTSKSIDVSGAFARPSTVRV